MHGDHPCSPQYLLVMARDRLFFLWSRISNDRSGEDELEHALEWMLSRRSFLTIIRMLQATWATFFEGMGRRAKQRLKTEPRSSN